MNRDEVVGFGALPDKDLYVRQRSWDDLAKDPKESDVDLGPAFDMARRHLFAQAQHRSSVREAD